MKNIHEIAITRKHNTHYLNRYLRFIESRKSRMLDGYREKHHILPRAKDMFNEYEDFALYPWNMIELSSREHIIAHILLWKSFGGSQAHALWSMLSYFNSDTNPYLSGRQIPFHLLKRFADLREASAKFKSEVNKGRAVYKDQKGNVFTLRTDDPRIEAEGLVGFKKGIPHSEKALASIRAAQAKRSAEICPRRVVTLYRGGKEMKVRANDAAYPALLMDGWAEERTPEDMAETKARNDRAMSAILKGTMRYSLPDGAYFARLETTDPRIVELSLVPQITAAQRESARSHASLMSQANLGTTIYNNGVEEIKRLVHPGDGWVKGRLPRSDEYVKAQRDAIRARVAGSTTWNDGNRNYRLMEGEEPQPHWVRGMAPRRKKA